jgi:enoyl-CoA hydratase/carnithine racemase
MSDPVELDVTDGVATLTLNRPDNRNALTEELGTAIIETIDDLESHPDLRCLVITGKEGTFCAGGDVNAMMELMSGAAKLHEAVRLIQQETSRVIRRVADFHLPTIAKLEGTAYGAGANLAIATDIIVASPEARISFGFRQVGLAIDSGTSYLLPREVGLSKAKELVFTGKLLDADEAEQLGLFNHVFEAFEPEFEAFVDSIANGPTVGLRTSKNLLNQTPNSLKEAQDNEAFAQAAVFETDDHTEGASAFMEGREPDFAGE